MSWRRQLLARKSLDTILAEMEGGENRLKRALGPVSLTALGIGAVIGAGIFVATGAAAKDVAGPALMVSYLVAGMTCIFAALAASSGKHQQDHVHRGGRRGTPRSKRLFD